jgi:hypothetical protein
VTTCVGGYGGWPAHEPTGLWETVAGAWRCPVCYPWLRWDLSHIRHPPTQNDSWAKFATIENDSSGKLARE